ncbi:unnamed protein product, partial [Owenia fusiformis]
MRVKRPFMWRSPKRKMARSSFYLYKYFITLCGFISIGVVLMNNDISTIYTRFFKFRSELPHSSSNISKFLNKVFQETCYNTTILPNMPVNPKPMKTPVKPYPIVLVVSFNRYKYYDTIPYIELLYRDYFENILYCGPSQPPEDLMIKFQMSYVLFEQPGNQLDGAYIYNCTMQA